MYMRRFCGNARDYARAKLVHIHHRGDGAPGVAGGVDDPEDVAFFEASEALGDEDGDDDVFAAIGWGAADDARTRGECGVTRFQDESGLGAPGFPDGVNTPVKPEPRKGG